MDFFVMSVKTGKSAAEEENDTDGVTDPSRLSMGSQNTQKGGRHNSLIKIENHAYKQLTVVISSKIEQKKTCEDKLCDTYDFTLVKNVQLVLIINLHSKDVSKFQL